MAINRRSTVLAFLLISLCFADDSLKDALNAVNRRQRDLSDYPKIYDPYPADYAKDSYYNVDVDADDLEKLEYRQKELERALMDYFEEKGLVNEAASDSSSPFRERIEKDHAKQRNHFRNANNARHNEPRSERDDYPEFLNKHSIEYAPSRSYKRSYSYLGLNSVGMRKRSRSFQPDGPNESLYLLNYAPRDEAFNRLEEEEDSPYAEYVWYKYPPDRRSRTMSTYPHIGKQYPLVSKRSNPNEHYDVKRSVTKKTKTDPKVEKELSRIFNSKSETENKIAPTKKPLAMSTKKSTEKEATTQASTTTEKPLKFEKKSIDWSDYFGIDRRKKSDQSADNEWLVPRANTMAKKGDAQRMKLSDVDERLKNIEESIIDDTLKFTGAHQGADTKEMENVKDSIINRLATAYNLEKMRKALREYKETLAKQHSMRNNEDGINLADKRASVPRKQAIDEDMRPVTEDNNIKCTSSDENCDEQHYKVPREFMEQSTLRKGECEKIERACKEVSAPLGPYANVFEESCNMHQMCLLCGDNGWFSPTRQCNVLFLSKVDDLCDDDQECRAMARQSMKTLLQVNRILRTDFNSACHLECPDRQ